MVLLVLVVKLFEANIFSTWINVDVVVGRCPVRQVALTSACLHLARVYNSNFGCACGCLIFYRASAAGTAWTNLLADFDFMFLC